MRKLITLMALLILVLWSPDALAQRQYTIWYFGYGLGLDFNFSPPTLLTDGQTQLDEGSAAYCDPETGKLLLYTAGGTVWDRQHRVMPNGTELNSGFSSTQAALIVPDPVDQNRFYIFHTDHLNFNGQPMGLYYSVCDMRLNNGFGEITEKNVELLPSSTEKLTAVQICNDQLFWIIGHEKDNNTFVAWRLDENGLSTTPVRSRIGGAHGPQFMNWQGYLAASPDGSMLASAIGSKSIEIFRFNSSTGEVHDPIQLPRDAGSGYGVSFSPDNTKLYIGGTGTINQYDVTSWNSTIIASTVHRIPSELSPNSMKLGPDQKLYVQNGMYLGIVHKPNLSGNACEYVSKAIYEPNQISLGLPNNIDALGYRCEPRARIGLHPSTVCEGSCISFNDSSRHNPTHFLWTFDGATPSTSTDENPANICYDKEGTYTIKLVVANEFGIDSTTSTIRVKTCPIPEITLRDTTICISDCLTFKDTSTVSTRTEWLFTEGKPSSYTGKTPPLICYYREGRYPVRAIVSNEYGADTAIAYVTVENCDMPVASFVHDTLVCLGSSISFTDRSRNNIITWDWAFEGGTPAFSAEKNPKNITYSQIGVYPIRLIVSNTNGSDTMYSKVRVKECLPPVAVLNPYEICEGDCIYLEDSSTNDPDSWEWQLEGVTPGLHTSPKVGQVCYETPGRFSIQLISRNLYGADTVRSNVLVRPATGYAESSLNLSDAVVTCSPIDTAFWIYAGCKDNVFGLLSVNDPNILLSTSTVTIPANDSLRVPVRIAGLTPGNFSATISFSLNGEEMGVQCNYGVRVDEEKLVLSIMDPNFVTAHCESLTRELAVTNRACSEHEIRRIYLDSPSGITPFTISYDEAALRIAPEESLTIAITYDPTQPGDVNTDLVMETAAGNKHRYPLRGIRKPLPQLSLELRSTNHSTTAGEEVGVELAFETAVGDTALPSTISVTLDYNTDLISVNEVKPVSGWLLVDQNESSGKLHLMFNRVDGVSIVAGEQLAQITFKTYLAMEDSALIVLSSVVCNPDNEQFAACVLAAGYIGSGSIYVGELCGDGLLRETLGKQRQTSVIIQPNPIDNRSRKLTLVVHTSLMDELLTLELIDLSGKIYTLPTTLVRSGETFDITLPAVPAGSYTLRGKIAGEQVIRQVAIY